ncbi:phage baseplate assembly protein [Chelatococcus reniformis]|uniref:Baseplate hub protein gp44/GpP-like second domain-containing protein n=1 Tax=Chelatococcus reniformis TaxID=1494448 RepID=A0A916XGS5_9HYPH|nr:hypothetical protein [Chelatococcus reniformis]GGC70881.1 hypothetical protein GCM10010994_31800 [Chelatococcus reniformis]
MNGRRYRDWTSVSVSRAAGDESISRFAFDAASPSESGANWSGLKLKIGNTGEIRLGGVQVINGVINVRQVAFDASRHGLQVQGVSKWADTAQSAVDYTKGQFRKSSLSQVANSVLKPFGIKFKLEGSPEGADKAFDRVHVIPGETVFAFIERLCRMRHIFLTDDVSGDLVGFRSGSQTQVVADLQEGRNILSANVVMSDEYALGKIRTIGSKPGNDQSWGDDSRDVSATSENPGVGRNRQSVIMMEEPGDQRDAQLRANHEMSENAATQLLGTIVVQGWFRDDGTPWLNSLGKHVSVYSPMIFPSTRMTLAISQVVSTQDERSGTRTALSLCLPSRYGSSGMVETGGGAVNPAQPDGPDQ